LFLHAPEAVLIDLVVVEVIDMDGVALVIRLAVVDKFISKSSLAWESFTAKAKKSRSGRLMCLTG
jgi:hypothetical protein